jgi:hypothetical protein
MKSYAMPTQNNVGNKERENGSAIVIFLHLGHPQPVSASIAENKFRAIRSRMP